MKKWYEQLFSNYSGSYDKESFTQGTINEVDFIENEIGFNKNTTILDVGCGTGRHSIELAKRGYRVTGIDLSDDQIQRAINKAAKANVKTEFLIKDARSFSFEDQFDLVIMICEGAFPLMETDEMNFSILQNATKSLKNEGKLIFTTLNGLYPLFHSVKDFINKNAEDMKYEQNTFNLMTFRDHSTFEVTDDLDNKKTIHSDERYYVPSEITWLLKSLKYKSIEIFGCEVGNFTREKQLSHDDFEMLVIAEK
ncbi:MAG: class I SAM-dependent methyltransferase [Bacteroidales bacterium]|nr:class I SAM-dependent methyltransferase [Bacteroidales bacterium]